MNELLEKAGEAGLSPREVLELLEERQKWPPAVIDEILIKEILGERKNGCREELTDLGNAKRLAYRCIGRAMWCTERGKWMVWNNVRWAEEEYIMDIVEEVINGIALESPNDPEFKKWQKASQSHGHIKAMLELVKSERNTKINSFDKDPWKLNVENGTIDLQTNKLQHHNSNDMITKLAGVRFDPAAECPTWLSFLDQIMDGNQENIDFLQEWFGYGLTGDTREQCFAILDGRGANGKSTLLNVIRKIMGDYAETAEFSTFTKEQSETVRNDLAKIAGSRFVSAVECDESKYLDENVVKAITGNDPVTCRFLYKELFTYQPGYKISLATNHRPRIEGNDYGIWRRIRRVPFTVTIPPEQQDKMLESKLLAESSGILNWLLEGCLRWQQQGLSNPESIRDASEDYQEETQLGAFLLECIERIPSMRLTKKEMYEAYVEWAKARNERPYTMTNFGRKLKDAGFTEIRDKKERYWNNVWFSTQ